MQPDSVKTSDTTTATSCDPIVRHYLCLLLYYVWNSSFGSAPVVVYYCCTKFVQNDHPKNKALHFMYGYNYQTDFNPALFEK